MGERRRKECTATALKGAYVSSPFFSFARASALRLSFAPGARGAGAPLPLPAACAAAEDAALRVALARNGRDEGGKEEEEEKGALPAMVAAAAHALLSSSALSGSRAWRSRAASAAGLACAAVCVSLFGSRCGGALAWVFFFLFSFFSFSALLPRAVPPPPLGVGVVGSVQRLHQGAPPPTGHLSHLRRLPSVPPLCTRFSTARSTRTRWT